MSPPCRRARPSPAGRPGDPDRTAPGAPPQAVVEGPVSGGVRQRGQLEVPGPEGGQDPDHRHPAAVPGRGPVDDPEGLVELAGHGRERPTGQWRRGQVQLEVEPVDLQHHPRVGRLRPDLLVAGQGTALAVDQAQLQLGSDGDLAGAEAGPLQQPLQRHQALLQPHLEAPVVGGVEALALDRLPIGRRYGGRPPWTCNAPSGGLPPRSGDRRAVQGDPQGWHHVRGPTRRPGAVAA